MVGPRLAFRDQRRRPGWRCRIDSGDIHSVASELPKSDGVGDGLVLQFVDADLEVSANRSGEAARSVIPQSVWCRITRFQVPGTRVAALAWPTLLSIAIVPPASG